eukprot:1136388-Pelagomonas_calceolata.AAC.2
MGDILGPVLYTPTYTHAHTCTPSLVQSTYGLDLVLPGMSGFGRLVAWYAPGRKEGMSKIGIQRPGSGCLQRLQMSRKYRAFSQDDLTAGLFIKKKCLAAFAVITGLQLAGTTYVVWWAAVCGWERRNCVDPLYRLPGFFPREPHFKHLLSFVSAAVVGQQWGVRKELCNAG